MPADVRDRRRSKKAGKAPKNVLTGQSKPGTQQQASGATFPSPIFGTGQLKVKTMTTDNALRDASDPGRHGYHCRCGRFVVNAITGFSATRRWAPQPASVTRPAASGLSQSTGRSYRKHATPTHRRTNQAPRTALGPKDYQFDHKVCLTI